MVLRLGTRDVPDGVPLVMAVVNRTPDSFYAAGRTYDLDAAVAAADRAVQDGADIVDVGGVKAGTGAEVDADEECRRVLEPIAQIRARHPAVAISVDTWRAVVAERALAAGADVVNDAWGGTEPAVADVVAAAGAGLICTHAGGLAPRTDPRAVRYDDVVADVITTVVRLAERAADRGVDAERILVDPGHDFAKTTAHSLEVTRRLGELVATGWPVLVALSRKDFVGETLALGVDDRLEGTLAAVAVSAWNGARVFRAHDVRATRRVVDMVASIRGDRPPAAPRRGL